MEKTALISVIVPVYRVENYLRRCVDSILGQTYRNLEVILVDDGSPDGSGKICDEYAELDSRIRVIHKENGGLSSARNAGIDIARGDYLTFVDSDDWIEADAYEAMLEAMTAYDVKLVCAGRYDVDSETGEKTVGLCPGKTEKIPGEELVRRIFLWENADSSACDKLYAAELFRQIRFPEGVVCEDVPVMYRIVLDAGTVAVLNKPVYHYFHRPISITTSSVSEKTFHFSQHTRKIYDDIAKRHPTLEPPARYFRIASLVHNLLSLDLADEEDRKRFQKQYDDSCRELRKHFGFLLTAPYFRKQERLTDILLALGIYRPLRRLYHIFK